MIPSAWLALLASLWAAQEPAAPAAPAEPAPGPPAAAYRSHAQVLAWAEGWAAAAPTLVRQRELARSRGGREVPLLELGAQGDPPLDERPTVWLVGGLDGSSVWGAEAVLGAVDALLAAPEQLPKGVAFAAVPWASPDALERWLANVCVDGRNAAPDDEDGDGLIDEDGPDDLDGDGVVLALLVEDSSGEWTLSSDGRFPIPARPGARRRYSLAAEGRDDDGDGRFNEDGPGGVDLDRNFPLGWCGPQDGEPSGVLPLSEPESRALAELVLARASVAVLCFQGNHARLATPGGTSSGPLLPFPQDRAAFAWLAAALRQASAQVQPGAVALREARDAERRGAAIDWMYAGAGALAAEVSLFGPWRGDAREASFPALVEAARESGLSPLQEGWRRWLDDTRGGIGFADWAPVELGGGAQGLVGGWEPRTCHNPPPEELGPIVTGATAFVRAVARGLPRLELELRTLERRGALVRVAARVRNQGELPSGISLEGSRARRGLRVTLSLPEGTRLLVGEREQRVAHVDGGSSSARCEWLCLVPEGAVLSLAAADDWATSPALELRP